VPDVNLMTGDDGSNSLLGSATADLIYGFDPNGPQGDVSSLTLTRVAEDLAVPLFAVAPPGDMERLFIVEQSGQIKILDLATNTVLATPFLDLAGQILTNGEQGLLGLAFDPDFATNGYFYVNVIVDADAGGAVDNATEIRRYQVSGNPDVADAGSAHLVIRIDQPSSEIHKGGWLGFGPDGFLYAALGDGDATGGTDPANNGQNAETLLAKMLRLDVHGDDFALDGDRNYAIPADNPFVGVAGADEIWALGLRNPWRPSFDRGLDDLYIADVGQSAWEEINLGQAGANYGWDRFEGPLQLNPGTAQGPGTLTGPIYYYGDGNPNDGGGNSITGGYVYRGTSEGLQGHYFFADFVTGQVFTLHDDGGTWVATDRTAQLTGDTAFFGGNGPISFGQDGEGNLYITEVDGDVFRLTPNVLSADQADTLEGLGGNDMLFGGSGNDVLDGGEGDDELQGGPGTDTARFAGAAAGVTVSLAIAGPQATVNAGTDTLIDMENLTGSGFDDRLTGDALANSLEGGNGHDTVNGGAGADSALGGVGNDQLYGNAGMDSLIGGLGADSLSGGKGADQLAGNNGADYLEGNLGFDLLQGGNGNDTLVGGGGIDTFLYSANLLGSADVTANGHEFIQAAAGDLISMLGLIDELQINGTALSALTSDAVLGALSAGTSVGFAGGMLQVDLDDDGTFTAASDFQIALAGVSTVTYQAGDDLFHLA
jgi:glucose/arabinose dehydrogenase/Ca2+-binding RTX toxin-like protein